MTRLLGLAVALLLLVGTLGVAGPATGRTPCPYTSCPVTRVSVSGKPTLPAPARPIVKLKVDVNGSAKITGRVTLSFHRQGGGFAWSRTFGYPGGGAKRYRGPTLTKVGKYGVTARFTPKPGGIWRKSSDAYTLRVVR